jgi:hypothetical protein
MTADKSKIGFLILGAIGLVFTLLGLFAGFIQAERVLAERGSIKNLPELEWSALQNVVPGTQVILSGTLAENSLAADVGGLIIYIEEVWAVRYNDTEGSEGWEGSWNWLNTYLPDTGVNMDGNRVMITKGQNVVIEQPLHEFKLAVPRDGREVDGIKEGSIRHRGYKAGDEVTVVGEKESAAVAAARVFGGNRAALEQYLAYQVSGLRIAGVVMGLAGLVMIIVSFIFANRRQQV